MTEHLFLEPLDVLYLRGNRLFADAGAHSEAQMPPWPSLAAGALRSRMLVDHGIATERYGDNEREQLTEVGDALHASLGTPQSPGEFRLTNFTLARHRDGAIEPCMALPTDVVATEQNDQLTARYLQPRKLHDGIAGSCPLPQVPVLASDTQSKPEGGIWLTGEGFAAYLRGAPLANEHLLRSRALWQTDSRLGIALDSDRRTAADGQIYTSDTIAPAEGVGFLVGVAGAEGLLPQSGLLRFGGDGRGARIQPCANSLPPAPWKQIKESRQFRLLLTTPGLFPAGWQLPGLSQQDDGWHWQGDGFSARLVAASVPRQQTVSGWDLARRQPKPAQQAVPTGAIYWFDEFSGDPEALQTLLDQGLWPLIPASQRDASRRAEGFNNISFAAWASDPQGDH